MRAIASLCTRLPTLLVLLIGIACAPSAPPPEAAPDEDSAITSEDFESGSADSLTSVQGEDEDDDDDEEPEIGQPPSP